MKIQKISQSTYWFYIHSDVYVNHDMKTNKILLYDTTTGRYLESENMDCLKLIQELHEPKNLGVVELSRYYIDNKECENFIDEIISTGLGKLDEIKDNIPKPMVLLPILKIADDLSENDYSDESVGLNNLISYLSEISIYLGSDCKQNCKVCNHAYKQMRACFKPNSDTVLSTEIIEKIIQQSRNSNVKDINILGGDIFEYPYWNELISITEKHQYAYHFWVNYLNITNSDPFKGFSNIAYIKHILITFPINEAQFEFVVSNNKKETKYYFLVTNKNEYQLSMELIDKWEIESYQITPIYINTNEEFFKDYVFLDKPDIFSSTLEMRQIFCNQKLNSNNFGVLSFLSDGTVKSNMNTESLGNIYYNSILELIDKEIRLNTSWRKIRDTGRCSDCLYQFLCPPISNYELLMKRNSLCNNI